MPPPARPPQQRKQDTLDRLERDVDAWVATADPGTGTPYLVPLSFLWFDPRRLSGPYTYFRIHPRRLQAWREADELEDRELMRDGHWLVP